MNPYHQFVTEQVCLLHRARSIPLGGLPPNPRPALPPDALKALFFSPHPDDECISGGAALRLLREARMQVINVAVTQGSNKERQAARFAELTDACRYLGFGLVSTGPRGLERISAQTRQKDPAHWAAGVEGIFSILQEHRPRVVFCPHAADWNSTHIGTHYLVTDALKKMPAGFECYLIETEFWGAMTDPNLMVEISPDDLADLIAATTFHVGEVKRNPYHLLLPGWMLDNVRRGSELVGGQGGAAPDFTFAALYRLRKWSAGGPLNLYAGGKQVGRSTNLGEIFGSEIKMSK